MSGELIAIAITWLVLGAAQELDVNVQGFGASMGGLIALSITHAQSVLKWHKVLATK